MSADNPIFQSAIPPVTWLRLLLAPLRAMGRAGCDAAHADFAARPWSAVLVTLGYYASLSLIDFLLNRYLNSRSLAIWYSQTASSMGIIFIWLFYFALGAVSLPLYGILLRFGLRRALGADLPVEPAPLGTPAGVWLSLAWAVPILLLLLLLDDVLLLQPWLPVLHAVSRNAIGAAGIVAWMIPLYKIRTIYGIVQRSAASKRLSLVVLSPPVLIAIVVIVLAIGSGEHRNHEQPVTASAIPSAGGGAASTCNGRGPMLVPSAPQEQGATVMGVISPTEALAVIERGQKSVNGTLVQDYLDSPRVKVHADAAPVGTSSMVVVPTGMRLVVGQHIIYTTGYADPHHPCYYLPNIAKSY